MINIKLSDDVWSPQVEEAFLDAGVKFAATADGWKANIPDDRLDIIQIDLRELYLIDLSALSVLVILSRRLAHARSTISVLMPTHAPCARFVSNASFLEALQTGDADDPAVEVDITLPPPAHYKRMFPLRWVDVDEVDSYFVWVQKTIYSETEHGERLLSGTSTELTRIILSELIENVSEHSGHRRALISIWAQANERPQSSKHFYQTEQTTFRAARNSTLSSVFLTVCDEGIGIDRSLSSTYGNRGSEELVQFAFDRWSSRVDSSVNRGTRGLYKVARLAGGQFGFATIRTGEVSATVSPVTAADIGHATTAAAPSVFPGTLLRVQLPRHGTEPTILPPRAGRSETIQLIRLSPAHVKSRELLKRTISGRRNRANYLVLDVSDASVDSSRVADFLVDAAELSHPGSTVLLGFDLSDDLLAVEVEEANNRIADLAVSENSTTAFEPVLVVGSHFGFHRWVAASPELAAHLDQNMDISDSGVLRQLGESSALRRDPDGIWQLHLTPELLATSVQRHIDATASENLRYPTRGTHFLTSSLRPVKAWIDVDPMTRGSDQSPALLARVLMTQAMSSPRVKEEAPRVIFELGVDDELANQLASLIQGNRRDGMNDAQRVRHHDVEAGRPLSLPGSAPVVVLVQGVSKGYNARRLASYAIRQGHPVVAVLSLVDTRSQLGPISVWGDAIAVHSSAAIPLDLDQPPGKPEFLDSRGVGEPPQTLPRPPLAAGEFVKALSSANALMIGHFEGQLDRHFTFAIDRVAALADENVVTLLASAGAISMSTLAGPPRMINWIYDDAGDAELWPSPIAYSLAETFSGNSNEPVRKSSLNSRRVSRDSAQDQYVYLTWGSVSGGTQFQTIHDLARLGIQRLTVITVVSQLSAVVERHLRSVSTITVDDNTMEVRSIFLSRLPIEAYPQESCPMCIQAALTPGTHQVVVPIEAHREQQRMLVRPIPGSAKGHQADLIAEQYGGQSNARVQNALLRRRDLSGARASTRNAFEVKRAWATQLHMPEFVLGLATLLACEPNWLQSAPLTDDDVRQAVSDALIRQIVTSSGSTEDEADVARALIALRVVSKIDFVNFLPQMLLATRGGANSFGLAIHLTESLTTRRYLRRSALARDLVDKLTESIEALAASSTGATELRLVTQLLSAAEANRRADGISSEATRRLLKRLRRNVRRYYRHEIQMDVDVVSDPKSMFVLDRAAPAWGNIYTWMGANMAQLVGELRPYLNNVRGISHEHLERAFPTVDPLLSISEARTVVNNAAAAARELTPGERETLQSCWTSFDALMNRPSRDQDPGDRRSAFERAVDDCNWTVGQLWDELSDQVDRCDGGISLRPLEGELVDEWISMPSNYVAVLMNAVVRNALDHAVEEADLSIAFAASRPAAHDPSIELAFHAEGVKEAQTSRAKSLDAPGHFGELESMNVPGLHMSTFPDLSNGRFTLTIRVSEERHG